MLSAISVVLAAWACVAAAEVSGTVFHDANGNGRQDQGEAGVASAAVSDGKAVVQTDNAGRYALDVDRNTAVPLVFISLPSGYTASRFYAHVAASARAADFPLRRAERPSGFYFVHFTDCHVPHVATGSERFKYLRRAAPDCFARRSSSPAATSSIRWIRSRIPPR